MDDFDVWGTARKMIELYGGDAAGVAARRGDEALHRGDHRGFKRWNSMAEAISSRARRSAGPIGTL